LRPDTLAWWRQADADLQSVDIMLANSPWYAASWFAQQADERMRSRRCGSNSIAVNLRARMMFDSSEDP
jgi:hypothetical protein